MFWDTEMNILGPIIDKLAGGILKEGFEIVKDYFPSAQAKAEAQLVYERFVFEKQKEATTDALEADREFNQRIKDMEGTAADLKSIPVVGTIIIFIRGTQRPAWGCFTLYADYMVFSKAWDLTATPQLSSMLFLINALTLSFIFGERAVKNLLPFLKDFVGKKTK